MRNLTRIKQFCTRDLLASTSATPEVIDEEIERARERTERNRQQVRLAEARMELEVKP